MTRMTGKAFVILMISVVSVVDASDFLGWKPPQHLKELLKAHSPHAEERISEEDVKLNLLSEIADTSGDGRKLWRRHLKELEPMLAPMYAALPKNEQGFLGHATVRYALHRLFLQRHGWAVKGLHTAGGHRSDASSAGVLKEELPTKVQEIFEASLHGRGFGLHELGVLAATIKHLVHSEATKHLEAAYKVHGYSPTANISVNEADELLDTYMTSVIIVGNIQSSNTTAYVVAEDVENKTLAGVLQLKAEMPAMYTSWEETKTFVRSIRHNVTESAGSAEQEPGKLDFSTVERVAERVGEDFGTFQDKDCKQIKSSLVSIEEHDNGRVRLSDFYKATLDGGVVQFMESVNYLRKLGALDESHPANPRVIIANYLQSPSNCIASSTFYSVCCMDECEGLLGHLEEKIAAPEATTARIAGLVADLSSSTVVAPRKVSEKMLARLEEISARHGGSVPLHGRLFGQWMHHVFPRECPFPHLAGTTQPVTPDEWLEATGGVTGEATQEEMQAVIGKDTSTVMKGVEVLPEDEDEDDMPWSPEEELLVVRPTPMQPASGKSSFGATLRNGLVFASIVAIAYGLVEQSKPSAGKEASNVEKFFV